MKHKAYLMGMQHGCFIPCDFGTLPDEAALASLAQLAPGSEISSRWPRLGKVEPGSENSSRARKSRARLGSRAGELRKVKPARKSRAGLEKSIPDLEKSSQLGKVEPRLGKVKPQSAARKNSSPGGSRTHAHTHKPTPAHSHRHTHRHTYTNPPTQKLGHPNRDRRDRNVACRTQNSPSLSHVDKEDRALPPVPRNCLERKNGHLRRASSAGNSRQGRGVPRRSRPRAARRKQQAGAGVAASSGEAVAGVPRGEPRCCGPYSGCS